MRKVSAILITMAFLASSPTFMAKAQQPQKARTGRFANKIDVDTMGCPSVDLLEKAIDAVTHKRPMPSGCIDLNADGRGLPVFGPLEVVKPASARTCRDRYVTCWALIEISGKGKLWTFLAHLKDQHGN